MSAQLHRIDPQRVRDELAAALAWLDGVRKCRGAALVTRTPIDAIERDAIEAVERAARELVAVIS